MPAGRSVHEYPRFLAAILLSLPVVASTAPQTFYIRPDGGSARQCDGRSDRPKSEAGRSRDCAWSHPFVALPPGGEPRIDGGDTLFVRPGSYRIGIGAPGSEGCSADWPWDCHPPPLPSGSAAQPTRLSGVDADGRCMRKPEWWGAERSARLLNLDGSAHVIVECLEITDHSSCIEEHCHGGGCREVLRCPREHYPYGDWAGTGVFARDSRAVLLRDLDVHGLAMRGFHVGRVRDWTLQRVRIAGNGWSGWDGDLGDDIGSSNAGTLRFEQVEIGWNGCAERYPDRHPIGCWAQTTGGYGDGLGTAETAGHWEFVDVHVHHNTSDGLDLLYMTDPGSVSVTRLRAESNAGNQLKVSGNARIVDSTIDGRCDYFTDRDNMRDEDQCRALGNAVSVVLRPSTRAELQRNRIAGGGDCLVVLEGGDASSELALSGNRLQGAPMWSDRARRACGFYAHESSARIDARDNDLIGTRGACPAGSRCRAEGDPSIGH